MPKGCAAAASDERMRAVGDFVERWVGEVSICAVAQEGGLAEVEGG